MLIEDFKSKFTTIPFATHTKHYLKNARRKNIDTLFHIHKEIEVMLVLEGRAKLYIDDQTYIIEKDNIIFIPPYTPHRYTIFSDYDFNHYCLCFDAEILSDPKLKEKLENGTFGIKTIICEDKYCAAYIENAFQANAEKGKAWELQVKGSLMLLFATLLEKGYVFSVSETKKDAVYFQIVDYISRHYNADVTSSHLAKVLHMNHSYFCRLFRRSFGYCFQNYLCMFRIEKSKPLLKNTNLSVSEIASLVGFNNVSYFCKRFKEYILVSPQKYRQENQ